MSALRIKRVYEPGDKQDGYRILVDRLWPRGLKKDTAGIDEWLKEAAPSTALRKWFGHDPERWAEFKTKYLAELNNNDAWKALLDRVRAHQTVTLVYAAKDEVHNQAVILLEHLQKALKK